MATTTTCRGCGFKVSSSAHFCMVCRAPDPVVYGLATTPVPRSLVAGAGVAVLLWAAAFVGLWLAYAH